MLSEADRQAARMHCTREAERLTGAVSCQAGIIALRDATRIVQVIRGCRDDAHLAIKGVSRASEVALHSKAWSQNNVRYSYALFGARQRC